MTKTMKKFLEIVSADKELTEIIGMANREELISMAKKMGFDLTDADFAKPDMKALDDSELDAVAGGSECYCSRGGSGAGITTVQPVPVHWAVMATALTTKAVAAARMPVGAETIDQAGLYAN